MLDRSWLKRHSRPRWQPEGRRKSKQMPAYKGQGQDGASIPTWLMGRRGDGVGRLAGTQAASDDVTFFSAVDTDNGGKVVGELALVSPCTQALSEAGKAKVY
eukprot:1145833-Pelagomonas_calceolata.AAC.6